MDYFSAAAARNSQAIFAELQRLLQQAQTLLEIGSGTGQHCHYANSALAHISWQCSDIPANLVRLNNNLSQFFNAEQTGPSPTALALDVNDPAWRSGELLSNRYDALFSANTLHIMDTDSVEHFFAGTRHVLRTQGTLIIYGPFKIAGRFTSASNAQFDATLRARGVGSGIRDLEWIDELAADSGLQRRENIAMPANNQLLVYR